MRLLSLQEWFEGSHLMGDETPPHEWVLHLLDVRTQSEFLRKRIRSSHSTANATTPATNVVNIPLSTLKRRRFELPPRNVSFAILMNGISQQNNNQDNVGGNNNNNMEMIEDCFDAVQRDNKKRKRNDNGGQQKPWKIIGILDGDCEETWTQAKALQILEEEGEGEKDTETAFVPLPRLWVPDQMVQHLLLPLLKQRLGLGNDTSNIHNFDSVEIWDLGSGAGRDVCFLAEELRCWMTTATAATTGHPPLSFRIVAMDQRYRMAGNGQQEKEECHQFWTRRGVGDCAVCQQIDLEKAHALHEPLNDLTRGQDDNKGNQLLVIFAVRYWNQSLVEQFLIHNKNLCGAGNALQSVIFALSHFGKPTEDAPWNFDHPKEKHVLERSQLSKLFQPEFAEFSWKIHHDRVASDGDHGRTLIQFVAESMPLGKSGSHVNSALTQI